MLRTGMIEMTRTERLGVDKLLLELGEPKAGISRSEPNEQGSLLVKTADGVWEINSEGVSAKVVKDG